LASLAGLLSACMPAFADCTIERATYTDTDGVARIEFRPGDNAATVTNTFKMLLDNNVVLDGVVQWSQGVSRPYGMLMYKCPEGDVTGPELEQCTVWQGVIYTADETGNVALLPAEGLAAPRKLILADLGPSLRMSAAYGVNGFAKLPSDVFEQKGCQ